MEREQLLKGLKYLGVAYNKDFTSDQATVWFDVFKDTDYTTFGKAIKRLVVTSKFLPTIADLRREIALLENPYLGLDALSEWEQVLSLIREHGFYKHEQAFKEMNPLTQNIVRQLGWSNLCSSENIVWLKKEFVDIFNNKQVWVERLEALPEPTMTLAELTQKAKEYHDQETKLIEKKGEKNGQIEDIA